MTRSAIVRGGYIANRTSRARRSVQPVKRFIHYVTFGPYEPFAQQPLTPRGVWLDQHLEPCTQAQVLQWAKEQVHHAKLPHTYQMLLSTRHGDLTPEAFQHTLQAGSGTVGVVDWRKMIHTDTDNQHAHVILFRDRKLNKATYLAWQQTLQDTLEAQHHTRWQQGIEEAVDAVETEEPASAEAAPQQSQPSLALEGWL